MKQSLEEGLKSYSISLKFFPKSTCFLVLAFSVDDSVQSFTQASNEVILGLCKETRETFGFPQEPEPIDRVEVGR